MGEMADLQTDQMAMEPGAGEEKINILLRNYHENSQLRHNEYPQS